MSLFEGMLQVKTKMLCFFLNLFSIVIPIAIIDL